MVAEIRRRCWRRMKRRRGLLMLLRPAAQAFQRDYSLRSVGESRRNCSSWSGSQQDLSASLEVSVSSRSEEVVIAMGANVGDRVKNFSSALKLMRDAGVQIKKHSCLYETVPMHFLDQPLFLNSAVNAVTSLDPQELLRVLKRIENQLGRSRDGVRYGPRPIDLDIIFYGDSRHTSEDLQVPHPMFSSRPFVLAPLIDLLGQNSKLWDFYRDQVLGLWNDLGGEACVAREGMRKVMLVKGKLLDWDERTYVMGVLNVTPDSFSDGGQFVSVGKAVRRVEEMVFQGADFIDIGAQSTRPNARRISAEEEMQRLLPVLEEVGRLRNREEFSVSVDTFDSRVARAAVDLGADLVNDVSAGSLDPEMFQAVAEMEVPYVLMHMRGDPCTMMSDENTRYEDLAAEVAAELKRRIEAAEAAGIPAWRMIVDPGFGFSKNVEQNVELLAGLSRFKRSFGGSFPVLAGVSRKGFLGRICGYEKGEDRDMATVAAVTAAVLDGANIVRGHNVRGLRDAALVSDSIIKYKV